MVDNDFPIQQSGILSSEFSSDNSTKIDYENQVFEVCGKRYSFRTGEVMAFVAGERKLFFARVTNNIEEGYTPYMTYDPGGIVIEPGFVRNQDGKAYFFLTNAYDYPINIEIPVIKLMSVERYYEILSLEAQCEDEINAKKESGNIVLKTDKNEKNLGNYDNVKKEKSPGNRENFVPSFDKNKKNPNSLEKVEKVEKEKSPGNRESLVPNFYKKERNPRNHENFKKERNPSSHEKIVSSLDKNEKKPSNHENFKKERNPSSREKIVSSLYKNEKKPSNHENVEKERNPSSHEKIVSSLDKNGKRPSNHENVKKERNPSNHEKRNPSSHEKIVPS